MTGPFAPSASSPDRILVVADRPPLPANAGGRQRLWNYLLALDLLAPGDLVVIGEVTDAELSLFKAHLPRWTLQSIPRFKHRSKVASKLWHTMRGHITSDMAAIDFKRIVKVLQSIAATRELVVAIQPMAAIAVRRLRGTRTRMVDLWDVDDVRLVAPPPPTRWRDPRAVWSTFRDRRDRAARARFQMHLPSWAQAITVCSDQERAKLPPSDRWWVVPNGADIRHTNGSVELDRRTGVIVFHGHLTYEPNAEASRVLADEVLPLVQAVHGQATVRIVGRADERVKRLHRPPDIVVTGFVEDIDAELGRAEALCVALRSGGGTRLKILEAFSMGLPVVSTTVGAEGLNVRSGVHLLIGDTSLELAESIIRLMNDADLARRLALSARELVVAEYDWSLIRQRMADRMSKAGFLTLTASD